MQTLALFDEPEISREPKQIADGAMLLPGFALAVDRELLEAVERIVTAAPFRHLQTPGGLTMSVAMSNCGHQGWVTFLFGMQHMS